VIGVLPASFRFPDVKADIWESPTFLHPEGQRQGQGRYLAPIARLRPGVTRSQAQAEMNVIMAQLAREFPDFNKGWGVTVIPCASSLPAICERQCWCSWARSAWCC